MVDDHDATTDTPMIPSASAVGVATVQPMPTNPLQDPKPLQAPKPPPPAETPVDEVLRWLADVAAMAGPPNSLDVSVTTRHIDITAYDLVFHTRWLMLVGALEQSEQRDALGVMVIATTPLADRWSVTIRTHVDHGMATT
jgi:hypothetical protein